MKRIYLCLLLMLSGFFNGSIDARFYFMHVPKTGGTTLRLLLEQQLSVDEIYPFRNCKSATMPIKEILVSGHFPYWFYKDLDADFEKAFKVTIFREPIERYLSFLRAKKKADTEFKDLESILRLRQVAGNKYHVGLIDNAFCRYLSENQFLEGKALLESAKRTLDDFDSIVFFDSFDQDVITLFAQLGIELDREDIPRINVTEKEPVSMHLLDEIRQINDLDIQLYEYAKKKVFKKNIKYSLRTSSYDKILNKNCSVDYTFDQPLNGKGWTYREISNDQRVLYPVYRWVMDYPATIYFSLEMDSEYVLRFAAQSLLDKVIPRVKVNGKEIEILKINDDVFSMYEGVIPQDWIGPHPTQITFYSLEAFQYRDVYPNHYNRNHPTLSFALNRIQIFKQD